MIDIQKELEKKIPKLNNESFVKQSIVKAVQVLSHEKSINEFLKKNEHLYGFDFIEAVLEYFHFDFECSGKDLQNIPASSRVVIIANHPLGSLDALVLLHMVGKVRNDVKIVANDFLMQLEPLESLLLGVNNFKTRQSKQSVKDMYHSLYKEEALIIFPAGEVSRMSAKGVRDKKWHKSFLELAKNTNSPILPVHINGRNSKTFYAVSAMSKPFSTLLLSHEMFKKKNQKIKITVGDIIPFEAIVPRGIKTKELVKRYKKHLYTLKKNKKPYFMTQKAIAHPAQRHRVKKELEKSQLLGKTKDGKVIYLANFCENSALIQELGRLREISFRKVGEGTNKSRDIDKFDTYYQHIVLWDDAEFDIVGSYRVGQSQEIFKKYQEEGFYSHSLFGFSKNFVPYLQNSIELGRSFVQPKYWGSRALDYLWYGIGAYLKANPQIEYMFGPVSLSGTYPKEAKDAIISYYTHYYSGKNDFVQARLPYTFSQNNDEINTIFALDDKKADLKRLKLFLKNLGVTLPTLYKQYSELCEESGTQFLSFNIDKDFAECVDGFVLVEVGKIKKSQKERYIQKRLDK